MEKDSRLVEEAKKHSIGDEFEFEGDTIRLIDVVVRPERTTYVMKGFKKKK